MKSKYSCPLCFLCGTLLGIAYLLYNGKTLSVFYFINFLPLILYIFYRIGKNLDRKIEEKTAKFDSKQKEPLNI